MDLQDNLIECNPSKNKRGWKASCASIVAHALMLAFIIYLGTSAASKIDAEEKPMRAYIMQGAAPPPPPPPPPPPAPAGSSAPKATPQAPKAVTHLQINPVHIAQLTPPREIPKEIPKINPTPMPEQHVLKIEDATQSTPQPMISSSGSDSGSSNNLPATAGSGSGNNPAGVPGGIDGGVAGGVVGGQVGGVVGGVIGGEKGGVLGGQVGGKVGGTGTGAEGNGSGDRAQPAGPLRVGGDVKAPVIVSKYEPKYTEPARQARVTGIVIVEATINKQGEVENVNVIKGLPMGLSDQAVDAVKRWRFRPGTLNGEPVDVIFNLTVNFKMD
jgi:periplasmic protein TonB